MSDSKLTEPQCIFMSNATEPSDCPPCWYPLARSLSKEICVAGNHFVEVLYDEAGQVWAMLHSGSRGIG